MEPGPLPDRLPRLAFIDGPLRGHTFELDGGPWSLGRGRGNRLTVEDPSLSRQHCRIAAIAYPRDPGDCDTPLARLLSAEECALA